MPADVAYGVLGSVLAQMGSLGREFRFACVPAGAKRLVVQPLSRVQSLPKIRNRAVGGEPGVADVLPLQAFLAARWIQGYPVCQVHTYIRTH